jgi:hypothetical protein
MHIYIYIFIYHYVPMQLLVIQFDLCTGHITHHTNKHHGGLDDDSYI